METSESDRLRGTNRVALANHGCLECRLPLSSITRKSDIPDLFVLNSGYEAVLMPKNSSIDSQFASGSLCLRRFEETHSLTIAIEAVTIYCWVVASRPFTELVSSSGWLLSSHKYESGV